MQWPFGLRGEHARVSISQVFLMSPGSRWSGSDISRRSAVRSDRMESILAQMSADGWIEDGQEEPPPGRWYRATALGCREMAGLDQKEAWKASGLGL